MPDDDTRLLDTTGLDCPLPVLKAEKALRSLAAGASLRVLATDPLSVVDIPHMCRTRGHVLVSSGEREGVFVFEIRRGDKAPE